MFGAPTKPQHIKQSDLAICTTPLNTQPYTSSHGQKYINGYGCRMSFNDSNEGYQRINNIGFFFILLLGMLYLNVILSTYIHVCCYFGEIYFYDTMGNDDEIGSTYRQGNKRVQGSEPQGVLLGWLVSYAALVYSICVRRSTCVCRHNYLTCEYKESFVFLSSLCFFFC